MNLRTFLPALGALAVSSASLSAQADTAATQCGAGPGALFGVTGYQCANCSFTRDINGAARYTFNAEPTVLSTTDGTLVQAGDVIVAVNSNPIVSRLGSDQFTYPSAGRAVLTVRRGDQRVDLLFTMSTTCRGPLRRGENFMFGGGTVAADTMRVGVGGGTGSGRGGRAGGGAIAGTIPRTGGGGVMGRGGRMSSADTARAAAILDSAARRMRESQARMSGTYDSTVTVRGRAFAFADTGRALTQEQQRRTAQDADERQRQLESQVLAMRQMIDQLARQVESSRVASTSGSEADMGRFGLALGCTPSCARVRTNDGSSFYRYEEHPPIVALRTNGPAALAGLRVGDVVTHVDGISIITTAGAQRFFSANAADRLTLTVRRNGEDRRVVMTVGPPR